MIGKAIQIIRDKRGLSQKALAKMSNMMSSTLCNIENEHTMPTKQSLVSISIALDVPISLICLLSTTELDVKEDHRPVFESYKQGMIALLDTK